MTEAKPAAKPAAAPAQIDPETAQQLAALALRLGRGETRREFIKLVKKVDPSRSFPDVEMQDLREEMESKFAEEETKRQAAATKKRMEEARQALIDSGRFTEDDVKKIETDVMQAKGIADYETAAVLYGAQHAPAKAAPEISTGGTWTFPDHKGLREDPNKWARDQAFAAVGEIKARRR